jgi:hypothetical protein
MRRITIWITATVAVLALMVSYQANVSGVTGKAGDHQSTSTGSDTGGTTAKPGEAK